MTLTRLAFFVLVLAGCASRRPATIADLLARESSKLPQPPCPAGMVEAGGLALSGAIYPGGCYTPEGKAKADLWFAEMWCAEGGIGWMSFDDNWRVLISYSHEQTWKDGQCHSEDVYRIEGEVVSKEEFERRHPIHCDAGSKQDGFACRLEQSQ